MRKKIFAILLAMAFLGGASCLLKTLPLGLSSNAYATPDKGSKCSKCHGWERNLKINVLNYKRAEAGAEGASRSLNVLKIDSPLHRKCRELLIAAD